MLLYEFTTNGYTLKSKVLRDFTRFCLIKTLLEIAAGQTRNLEKTSLHYTINNIRSQPNDSKHSITRVKVMMTKLNLN